MHANVCACDLNTAQCGDCNGVRFNGMRDGVAAMARPWWGFCRLLRLHGGKQSVAAHVTPSPLHVVRHRSSEYDVVWNITSPCVLLVVHCCSSTRPCETIPAARAVLQGGAGEWDGMPFGPVRPVDA